MPSKSWEQHRMMQAAAHDEEFAKKNNIDQEVAKEFLEADKKAGLNTKEDFEKLKKKKKAKLPKYVGWKK